MTRDEWIELASQKLRPEDISQTLQSVDFGALRNALLAKGVITYEDLQKESEALFNLFPPP